MEGRARTVLTAIVVVLVLGVPLAVLFASGGGEEKPRPVAEAGLRLERSTALPELLVYVDAAANQPQRAGGARSVTLRCVDADGRLVTAQDEAWPFGDTDAGTLDPHAHVRLDSESMARVRRCSLVGTEPPLAGTVP
jgi:hypothetical protein